MTTATQNTAPTAGTATAQPTIPAPGEVITSALHVEPQIEYSKIFAEATKYTVVAAFALYFVGFITWHSYLETYGISSMGFLQSEYLSAALCYMFVFLGFALPPAVLIDRFINREIDKGALHSNYSLLFIWYLISTRLLDSFFPDPHPSLVWKNFFDFGAIAALAYIILMFVSSPRWKRTKTYQILWKIDVPSIWLLVYVMGKLLSNNEVSKLFLFSSLAVCIFTILIARDDIQKFWMNANAMSKVLLLCLLSLIMIAHVQAFGSHQFGNIPKKMGGGKPETAFLRFSSQHPDLALSLNVPDSTNSFTKGFSGPVAILLRTEKTIVFVNYADYSGPDTLTNVSTSMTTNSIAGIIATNLQQQSITNIEARLITRYLSTNIVYYFTNQVTRSMREEVSKNVAKLAAKEVRSELVDAVVFGR